MQSLYGRVYKIDKENRISRQKRKAKIFEHVYELCERNELPVYMCVCLCSVYVCSLRFSFTPLIYLVACPFKL